MFGTMNVIPVLDLRNAPAEVANCSDRAMARLLDITDHPKIEKWVQFRRRGSRIRRVLRVRPPLKSLVLDRF